MKFSTLIPSFPPKGKLMYHITPTENVSSILDQGLVRGSRRSTNGIETQSKIYLTNSIWGIDDPFPNHFGWVHKDMSVLEVDMNGLESEVDPEYDAGNFFMVESDIPPKRIKNLGLCQFTNKDSKYYGSVIPSETVLESIVQSGDGWDVIDSKKTRVLGHHDNKKDALAQLAAVEISKQMRESEEYPDGKYDGATKVGIYSHGTVTGYGYRMKDGSIDIDGLKFTDETQAKMYGFDIEDLPPNYDKMLGRHFHARR